MVNPIFPALLGCLKELFARAEEEFPSDFVPLVLNAFGPR